MLNQILKIGFLLLLIQCGKSGKAGEYTSKGLGSQSESGVPIVVLISNTIKVEEGVIRGTGQIRVKTPVSSQRTDSNYGIKFRIDHVGYMIIHLNADETLLGGISLIIQRNDNNVGGEIVAYIVTPDRSIRVNELKTLDWAQDIYLRIDLHNSEDVPHFIIWDGTKEFHVELPLFHSKNADGTMQGPGRSVNWGVTMGNAEVYGLSQGDALSSDTE